jgi:hypothetical protein
LAVLDEFAGKVRLYGQGAPYSPRVSLQEAREPRGRACALAEKDKRLRISTLSQTKIGAGYAAAFRVKST